MKTVNEVPEKFQRIHGHVHYLDLYTVLVRTVFFSEVRGSEAYRPVRTPRPTLMYCRH